MRSDLVGMKQRLEKFAGYRALWMRRNRRRAETDLFYALKYLALKYFGEMTFLQIGGNDGRTGDPIHRFVAEFHWRGVIVEPQKEVFASGLQQTYGRCPGIFLENCAIDRESSERILYKIGFSDARWATGLATFDRSTLERLIENGYVAKMAGDEGVAIPESKEDCIAEESVLTMTVNQVLERHGFNSVKLVVVDTEGYDGQIIRSMDLSKVGPSAVIFEWIHLASGEYSELRDLFSAHGYGLNKMGTNCVAWK